MTRRILDKKESKITIADIFAVDWVTFTSRDYSLYEIGVLWLTGVADVNDMKIRVSSREQYRGQSTDCGFCGVGEQGESLDFMVVVSGGWAYEFFRDCHSELSEIFKKGGGAKMLKD